MNGNRKGLQTDLLTQTIALVATPLQCKVGSHKNDHYNGDTDVKKLFRS